MFFSTAALPAQLEIGNISKVFKKNKQKAFKSLSFLLRSRMGTH